MPSNKAATGPLVDSVFPWLAGTFAVHLGFALLLRGGTWADAIAGGSWSSAELLLASGVLAGVGVGSVLAYRLLLQAPLLSSKGWMFLAGLAVGLTLFLAAIGGVSSQNQFFGLLSGSATAVICGIKARRQTSEMDT